MRATLSWVSLFLLVMVTVSFAGTLVSQINIMPDSPTSKSTLNAGVLILKPATSSSGSDVRDVVKGLYTQCSQAADIFACMQIRANQLNAGSDYRIELDTLPNAQVSFSTLNPITGGFTPIPGCELLPADKQITVYKTDKTGQSIRTAYWYAQCAVPTSNQLSTVVKVDFFPTTYNGDDVLGASASYEINNAQVSPGSTLTKTLYDIVVAFADPSNPNFPAISGAGTFPCFTAFLIMGLLFASMYFSGKSPLSLLDIQTPKLPMPKGLTASGQILAPFGYTELKKTIKDQWPHYIKSMSELSGRLGGPAVNAALLAKASNLSEKRVDAGGDLKYQRSVVTSILRAGTFAGYNATQLSILANTLPHYYGDAQHK
ncbi:hypothetical protein HZC07_00400, partial [Candidatus Micrarchaeota archaeon]|nr:hypothetical protein [Candidatus Micrarchaeota archaeon]